jgi:hypothetical protein
MEIRQKVVRNQQRPLAKYEAERTYDYKLKFLQRTIFVPPTVPYMVSSTSVKTRPTTWAPSPALRTG